VARVDLAYPELKIAIEYDGDGHRSDREQWRRDIRRQRELERRGWIVIHLTQADLDDPDAFLTHLRHARGTRLASGVRAQPGVWARPGDLTRGWRGAGCRFSDAMSDIWLPAPEAGGATRLAGGATRQGRRRNVRGSWLGEAPAEFRSAADPARERTMPRTARS